MFTKKINQNFFKNWSSNMSYVLGYIAADGCISESKNRKNNPFTLNITSKDVKHLYKIRKVLGSEHKIGEKLGGSGNINYQFQTRNPVITNDLIKLGITPRKTFRLKPLNVPDKYFSDFVRGFFDGDGSVFIYKVNNTPQIKTTFVCASSSFITDLNQRICKQIGVPQKSVHKQNSLKRKNRKILYAINFYINDCAKLYKFMYKNKPELYLERKYQIFKKWETTERRHYKKQNYPSKIGWHLNKKLCSQI